LFRVCSCGFVDNLFSVSESLVVRFREGELEINDECRTVIC